MRRRYPLSIALLAMPLAASPLRAQAADFDVPPARSAVFPPGIGTRAAAGGRVYADAKGLTLYGMDIRNVVGETGLPLIYCRGDCAAIWKPLRPPAGAVATPGVFFPGQPRPAGVEQDARPAEPAGDWEIVEGADGLQYLYKRVNLVFVRKADRPGSTAHDGEGNFTWNTLKYVPPVPKLAAPGNVVPRFVNGAYALADDRGHLLFVARTPGKCREACAAWSVFPAGLANGGAGDWSVSRDGEGARWAWRGRPVYVADGDDLAALPGDAQVLRP